MTIHDFVLDILRERFPPYKRLPTNAMDSVRAEVDRAIIHYLANRYKTYGIPSMFKMSEHYPCNRNTLSKKIAELNINLDIFTDHYQLSQNHLLYGHKRHNPRNKPSSATATSSTDLTTK